MFVSDGRQTFPYRIEEGLTVIRAQSDGQSAYNATSKTFVFLMSASVGIVAQPLRIRRQSHRHIALGLARQIEGISGRILLRQRAAARLREGDQVTGVCVTQRRIKNEIAWEQKRFVHGSGSRRFGHVCGHFRSRGTRSRRRLCSPARAHPPFEFVALSLRRSIRVD